MSRADLHAHSSFSYDVPNLASLEPRALFEKALGNPEAQARMDFFCLTDHDTMDGWSDLVRQLPESDRKLVIPAVEHTLLDPTVGFTIHVNIYGLDPDTYARLQRQVETVDCLLAFCAEHGLRCQYNHPTWWEVDEYRAGLVDFELVPLLARRFPVLELNAGRTAAANLITMRLAQDLGKVLTSNSDSHCGDIGIACNEADGNNPEEFLANIWAGRNTTRSRFLTYDNLLETVHGMIDGILDEEPVGVDQHTLRANNRILTMALARLLASQKMRRWRAMREGVRLSLKQLSKPIVRRKMGFEEELEARLATSRLGSYLSWE